MIREDILKNLKDIVVHEEGMLEEEVYIKISEDSLIYVDKFLELFGDYELTLSSIRNVESVIWQERFGDWNERNILPD